jgi:hypothetical protein
MAITRNAPHPNASVLFYDLMLIVWETKTCGRQASAMPCAIIFLLKFELPAQSKLHF